MNKTHTVPGTNFEALFRGLELNQPYRDELRKAGIDPDRVDAYYPTDAWYRTVELAREHLYPTLDRDEAFRRIGAAFVDGFFGTMLGQVVKTFAGTIGPVRLLKRLEPLMQEARRDMEVDVVAESPTHFRVVFREPRPMAEFHAGVTESMLHYARAKDARVETVWIDAAAGRYELVLTWS